MNIAIIAAMSRNLVIGKNNQIPWHIPADFKRVKTLTTGNTIIMGRKTYDSIGKPLPNRTNIVLSRQSDFKADGVIVVPSLEEALSQSQGMAFIFGGSALYQMTLDRADQLFLTLIDQDIEGDTFFPQWNREDWIITQQSQHQHDNLSYQFIDMKRKT